MRSTWRGIGSTDTTHARGELEERRRTGSSLFWSDSGQLLPWVVAILGSEHQGGHAVGPCLIWVRLCLEQDEGAPLMAIWGSSYQGGDAIVVLSAHHGARLKQDASNLLVAI